MELVKKEEMVDGIGDNNPKSYTKLSLSKKEIEGAKNVTLELIEEGILEMTEVGMSRFPTGLFLIHHPRYLPRIDGKVHGLRVEGGGLLSGSNRRYPIPIQKAGQQCTTCAACGKDVLLHVDFRPGDVSIENGAFCLDCVIGHPERRIQMTFVDKDLKFKTVYKPNEGAYITNEGVMRSYVGEQWRKEYGLEIGDSIGFYRVVEDNSGLFLGKIFVKAIKGEKGKKSLAIISDIITDKSPELVIGNIELAMSSCIENIRNVNMLTGSIDMRKDKITALQDKIDSLKNELNIENTILEDEKRKLDICSKEIEKGEKHIFDMIKKYMQEQANAKGLI